MPLCEVADTSFRIQGDDIFRPLPCVIPGDSTQYFTSYEFYSGICKGFSRTTKIYFHGQTQEVKTALI